MIKISSIATLILATVCNSAFAVDENLRDPTRPLAYTVAQTDTPEFVLQAILQRDSGPEAIVNGQRVKAGGTVNGARISRITDHSIVYSYRGQSHTVRLRPQIITRQSP